ncbi:porin family protein [Hymenobacter arizonensis]|uniref:Outer membrane protein beta-barrel domain-containing protein n=1 Tax=Hymenobacter arizonensis TaxID=1227077 RepID=A0A1I5Y7Q6_HYMAR|nr:porin family protein [Hymenobacter arizonensis]SFQ40228.1 Outer membrane protein beta-barrel domain-containing protein [Hymenobacter arizonensis]
MKKLFFALLAFAASITTASAQIEIGLKISPSINSMRAESPSDKAFKSDGSQFGFGGGLVVDYFFGENYALSTGLLLNGRGGTISYRDVSGGQPFTATQKFNMQYLQAPLTVKLFTNEVAPDTRLYFQVGGSLNVPIGTRINSSKFYTDPATAQETKASDHVLFLDADALASLGVEFQLAKSTKVFAGISYNRGLIDIDRYFEKTRDFRDITIKNSSVALDLGIKF